MSEGGIELPPSRILTAPLVPAEPLVRVTRTSEQVRQEGSRAGEEVQVCCGKCLRRAYDLTIEQSLSFNYADIPQWHRTGAVVVERACPKCGVLATCRVTLTPGHRLEDGLDGPWRCADCGASLAYIEAVSGKVKASCRKCRQNVTTTARNAFFGGLKSADKEKARRRAADYDAVPF